MAFLKRAIITGVFYTGNQTDSLKYEWYNIVKSNQTLQPFEEFDWEPEHFLYYRARAITANIPNRNGDYFPDSELSKSYHTFRGKGVYYNHDSDSPEKAFGIILDAIYHDLPDDKYVQILAAIDKEEIEKKRPGLLNRIMSGQLNTTSMSVLVQECQCSYCGNIARSPEELCVHMNPKSADYIKGKKVNGQFVYEINRGLTFIEDSIVDIPADPTAYIFQVYASSDPIVTVNSPKLIEHFKKYSSVQMAAKSPKSINVPEPQSLENLVEKTIENKFLNRVKQIIDEQVRLKIDPVLQKIDQIVVPKLEPIVEQKVEEKKQVLDVPIPKPEEKPKEESKKESETIIKSEEPKNEQKPVIEQKEVRKESASVLDNSAKIVLEEIPEKLDISPFTIRLYENVYIVEKNGKKVGSIQLPEDFGKLPKKKQIEYITSQLKNMKTEETSQKEVNKMQGKYIKGETFDNSYFVFSDQDEKNVIKVKASDIIPEDIQNRILKDDQTVVTPDDIISQVVKLSEGSFDKLSKEVLPSLVKQASLKNEQLKKNAEWSWAEDEVPSTKIPKPSEGPVMSVNKEEIPEQKDLTGASVKVKQYFGKLPSKGVSEPVQSINVQSSQNLIIKQKIDLLKKALEEEKAKREEAEKELSNLKEKVEKKDKMSVIEELIPKINAIAELDEDQKVKITELLNKFAIPQLNILNQILEVLSSKTIEKEVDTFAQTTLDKIPLPIAPEKLEKPEKVKKEASIPQIFISSDNDEFDIIEIAQRSLDK